MSLPSVGLDISGDSVFLARTGFDLGRPVVEAIEQRKLESLWDCPLLVGAQPVLSLADTEIDFKPLQLSLSDNLDYHDVGCFELISSLPDGESDYILEVYPTAARGKYLGMSARVERLTALINRIGFAPSVGFCSGSFLSRGLALSRAYLNYCQREPGELVGLIDLTPPTASIALLYRDLPIGLCHLPFCEADLVDDEATVQLAIQARTLVNFQISTLAAEGLDLPLARLIITGATGKTRLSEIFRSQFPSGVATPELNRAFFGEAVPVELASEKFLVAIGLGSD